jgi:hypothetical protein
VAAANGRDTKDQARLGFSIAFCARADDLLRTNSATRGSVLLSLVITR